MLDSAWNLTPTGPNPRVRNRSPSAVGATACSHAMAGEMDPVAKTESRVRARVGMTRGTSGVIRVQASSAAGVVRARTAGDRRELLAHRPLDRHTSRRAVHRRARALSAAIRPCPRSRWPV
jgi:hypothetical protein